ncbi:hypothetical protein [Actinoplanes sp. HUAS TT8]|uniref:hypothetical protein n=1 Tax=Actinoplanes sp. HUAS TT8 TaxID=3447453 RepID=UPI003F51DB3F
MGQHARRRRHIGGLFAPLFGLTAQHHGPEGVFVLLCLTPIPAFLLGLMLTVPRVIPDRESPDFAEA